MLKDWIERKNDRKYAYNFATISELTSYVYCPRLCYFRQRYGEQPGVLNAAKEIYLSLRKGLDLKWARNRFLNIGGTEEVFDVAKRDFLIKDSLEDLEDYKPMDWEVTLASEKYRLKGIIDEIVLKNSEIKPLAISLRGPKEGVWFKDAIKVVSQIMLMNEENRMVNLSGGKIEGGLVYYCFDGKIREVKLDRRMRFHVIKLVERVLRLKKGFIPERIEGKKCQNCGYKRDCQTTASTFASKFL